MNGLSGRDVAERAGVEPERVVRFVALRILHPAEDGSSTSGDVRRTRLVHGLELGGIPIETVATAIERGELSLTFLDLPLYERFSELSDQTFKPTWTMSSSPPSDRPG